MLKRLAFSTILAFVVGVLMPYAASAAEISAAADVVAARVAAEQQLVALGINPGDAVVQVGPLNYAGPNCPGSGWNCTTATTVVQIGSRTAVSAVNATNTFACNANPMTPGVVTSLSGSCTIVQNNTTGTAGTNEARCVQWTSTNPATQTCNITQTNVNGTNRAFVVQVITQSQTEGLQTATQYATVDQTNLKGANESAVSQTIRQNESNLVAGGTGATQTQEAHQYIKVCQGGLNPCSEPSDGTNKSGVNQNHIQLASVQFDDGASGTITQKQNAGYQGPKSSSEVHQNTTDKTNDAALLQFSRHTGTVHNSGTDDEDYEPSATAGFTGTIFQKQGHSPSCSADGLCGFQFQNSTGVQRAFERQDEVQRLVAPPLATQIQFGPEFCCATQSGPNPNSVNEVSQSKALFHTSSFTTSSFTHGFIQGHCESSGNCDVTQTLTLNGTTISNSCTGTSCNTVVSCEQGVEGPPQCATGPGPVPPVPPCFGSCITFIPVREPSFLAVLPDEGSLTG